MRGKIFALIIALIVIGLFLNVGCKTSSNELTLIISTAQWFLEHNENGFGSILLRVSGHTNGERVTVLTFGDGLIGEFSLQLDEDLHFNEVVTIAFSHVGYTPPVQAETTVTAYRGEEKVEVRLQSGNIY
ncbi:MAG: hypothetical protein JSV88_03045 [Candidatus Aminicenantes bacterium]|nr:MAG: hypothetical protein JSV88_03045 [Candidatus Aminicenantes bacterium]